MTFKVKSLKSRPKSKPSWQQLASKLDSFWLNLKSKFSQPKQLTLELKPQPAKKTDQVLTNYYQRPPNSLLSIVSVFLIIVIGSVTIIYSAQTNFALGQFTQLTEELKPANLIKNFGKDLPQDQNGFTNILFLGQGGEGHDGGDLTDTIMIASLDQKTKSVVLFSIPRDLWVITEGTNYGSLKGGRINEVLRDNQRYFERNQGLSSDEAFQKARQVLYDKIKEITDINIHRYVTIDFRGFEQIVDAFGGVEVEVAETIHDTTYPGTVTYTTFHLDKGRQQLDGETALKYARSRHGTSDFDRAARQQQLINALKSKVLNFFTNSQADRITKIEEVISIIDNNIQTDLFQEGNLGELITLLEFAEELPRENLISRVINSDVFHAAHRTDILAPGGFLVTPKRDLYGGAFVLVPWLNLDRGHKYDQIKTYADFTFNHREVLSLNPPVINIENGTTRSYFAQDTASHLERYSIAVNELVTAEERSDTTKISYVPTPKNQEAVKQILRIMDAEVNYLPITDSDIVNNVITITLGADAVDDSHLIRIPKKESEINLPDLD